MCETTWGPRHNIAVLCYVLMLISACGKSVVVRCNAAAETAPQAAEVAQEAQAVQTLF